MNRPQQKSALRFPTLILMGAVCAALLAVALRTVSLLCFFDADIEYYQRDAIVPMLSGIFTALVAVAAVGIGILTRSKGTLFEADGKAQTLAVRITSILCALLLLCYALLQVRAANASGLSFSFGSILSLLSVLLSVLYFMMNLRPQDPAVQVLLGFGVILFLVLTLTTSYFDVLVPMNAPNKIFLHLSCLSLTLFLTAEFRALFGTIRKTFYWVSASLALLLSATYAIPALVACLAGAMPLSLYGGEFPTALLHMAFSLYILTRLAAFCAPTQKPLEDENNLTERNEEA